MTWFKRLRFLRIGVVSGLLSLPVAGATREDAPAAPPTNPQRLFPGQVSSSETNRPWSEAAGTVTFVGMSEDKVELELTSETGRLRVQIFEADLGRSAVLLGGEVRVRGYAAPGLNLDGNTVVESLVTPSFGEIFLERPSPEWLRRYPALSVSNVMGVQSNLLDLVHLEGKVRSVVPRDHLLLEQGATAVQVYSLQARAEMEGQSIHVAGRCWREGNGLVLSNAVCWPEIAPIGPAGELPLLTTVRQVLQMKLADNRKGYPVRITGVVTLVHRPTVRNEFTVNDGHGGVACLFDPKVNPLPHVGDYVEVTGQTGAGRFIPYIRVKATRVLGQALPPEPIRPTWEQMMNGSLVQQWVEIEGLVREVAGNRLFVNTREGEIEVQVYFFEEEADLQRFLNSIVRVRGTVAPLYDSQDKIIRGFLRVDSPLYIAVEVPGSADLFAVPSKTISDLYRFDPNGASSFYRVKVSGQVVHVGARECQIMQEGFGLRCAPPTGVRLAVGDRVEVSGFPELGSGSLLLRGAAVRKTGAGELPPAMRLSLKELLTGKHISTRVAVEGILVNQISSRSSQILEFQMERRLFAARLESGAEQLPSMPTGSRLELTGTCAGLGQIRPGGEGVDSIELLLNSPKDVVLLALPPWWTLHRIMIVLAVLALVLLAAFTWIHQLHRKLDVRTAQLEREIQQRERAEHLRALELERTRIARDIHDDLGSGLTRIGWLSELVSVDKLAPEKAEVHSRKIAYHATQMVRSLDEIVWAINPQNDTLHSLVQYITHYTHECFAQTPIRCRLDFPPELPKISLPSEIRHNLFLAYKEAVTNVLKHASASEVQVRLSCLDGLLTLVVRDNGTGFDPAARRAGRQGHGLENSRKRLEGLGGTYQCDSAPGQPTQVTLSVKIVKPAG